MQSSLRAENNVWVYGAICGLNSFHSHVMNSGRQKDTRKEDKERERGNTTNDNETTSLENGMKASNFEKPSFSP